MRSTLLGLTLFALGLATVALLAGPNAGAASSGTLDANVGPGFTISLTQNGVAVTSLPAGTYTINVNDQSSIHDFHLSGPGVSEATSVAGTGTTTWTVTLQPGSYHYQCDPHASVMKGDFTVTGGTTSTTTSSTTTTATTPSAPPPLRARIAAVRVSPRVVTVTVAANVRGRGVARLLAGTRRVAQASGAVPGRLQLRSGRALRSGRYVVRLRVTGGGSTVSLSRTVRVR
jgi:plastocyanin